MSRYTFTYIGFDAQQQESINTVLYFAASALDDQWEPVSVAADSDISFINLDAESGEQLLQAQRKIKADDCLVLMAENLAEQYEHYWSLEQKAFTPLNLKKLTELLNQVSACRVAIAKLPTEEVDAVVRQYMMAYRQGESIEEDGREKLEQAAVSDKLVQDNDIDTQHCVQQGLPEFDFDMAEELGHVDDSEVVALSLPDFFPLSAEYEEEQKHFTQAFDELDFLLDESLQIVDESSEEGDAAFTEQTEYEFELDLASILTMTNDTKPGVRNKQQASEFVAKVVDDLHSAAVPKRQKVISNVDIIVPTRTLSVKNYFFGLVQLARKDKACRVIRLSDLPLLYILPSHNQFYFAGTDNQLLQFVVADPKKLKVRTVKKIQLEKLLARVTILQPQALDALLVRAVLFVSQGRLLKGHKAERQVELTAWQGDINVAQLEKYTDIAQVMLHQPKNLYVVAELAQVSLTTLFDFYNICYLLGCIRILPATVNQVVRPKKSKKTFGYFLRTLFKNNLLNLLRSSR